MPTELQICYSILFVCFDIDILSLRTFFYKVLLQLNVYKLTRVFHAGFPKDASAHSSDEKKQLFSK